MRGLGAPGEPSAGGVGREARADTLPVPQPPRLSPWGFPQGTGDAGRARLQVPGPHLPGQVYRPPNRRWRSQGPGTHNRGDGGRPLLQLLQVQRLLGRGVGPGVAGRSEEAGPWRQEPAGKTSVRPTGSRPPGSSLDDGAGGAARERRRSRITGPRSLGSRWGLLPPSFLWSMQASQGAKTPPIPAQRPSQDQTLLRQPKARKAPEKPTLRAHTTLGPLEAARKAKNQPA